MRRRDIKVGLTVILALAVLYLVLLWSRRENPFAPEDHTYEIRFAHVSGLLAGDPVSVRGYAAGRVVSLTPEADAIRVRISLPPAIALYPDAQAEIQLRELLGGKQVAIDPGRGTQPLPSGSELAGRTAPDFSTAFSETGAVLDALDPQAAGRVLARTDTLLQRLDALAAAIDPPRVAETFDRLARSSAQLERLLSSPVVAGMPSRLDQTWTTLDSTLAQTRATLHHFEELGERVTTHSLPQADSALAALPDLLAQTSRLLRRADTLLYQLEDRETFAGRALHDPAFAQQVDSTLTELIGTLRQIQEDRILVGLRRRKR